MIAYNLIKLLSYIRKHIVQTIVL